MQKILRKRVWRDLRENLLRYLMLGFLIILGVYMIISLVGAAEVIINGVNEIAEKNQIEDGEFSVFVPLTEKEEEELRRYVWLERMFYLDFIQEDNSTLRLFQNRERVNLINLDKGRLAKKEGEAVLEKRYCEEKGLSVGDSIVISDEEFQIVGIGTVPDYDAPYKNLSDSSVDSDQFGLAFVDSNTYQKLKKTGGSVKTEEYLYAYRLLKSGTDGKLKEKLKDYKVDPEDIEDDCFQEYWERLAGDSEDIEDGIGKLYKGSVSLQEGLEELDGHRGTLRKGSEQIFEAFLSEAEEGLEAYGLKKKLTEKNFEKKLENLKEDSDNPFFRMKITSVLKQLKALKSYKDGITEYTKGTGKAAKGAAKLAKGMEELKDYTDDLEELFHMELNNLTMFLKADDNPRIRASANDQVISKVAGLVAGIIIMILFTYVISVFVIHSIEKESSVIGTLYALGIKRKDLLLHYLLLPVIVTFTAGAVGTVLGISDLGIPVQMQDCYNYFSVPELPRMIPPYLIAYGFIMPVVTAVVVNFLVICRRLSRPALELMKKEQKSGKISNLKLGDMGFIGKFRIRQMIRESRTGFTVILGMFISLLIMMLGIDCYVMCKHISVENKADTKYEYMYTYKYPEEKIPEGGEACFVKSLKKEIYGYNLDITLLGIEEDNPYFDANVKKGKNNVVVSSAMAQKYGLSIGDKLILSDEEEEQDYVFTIQEITQFSTGMYVFMHIDSMRELFGESDDYYNVVFSDYKLDIDAGRLSASISREEISKSSDVFVSMMMPMVLMMIIISALIFGIVMYLMMKVMIDRSAFSISLMKIFGYRTKEIGKLYLNGNFYMIAVGAAICIPLSKQAVDAIYPLMVSNIACGMNLSFSRQLYFEIYAAIIVLYLVINKMLSGRLKKVTPAEVLKNRE